MEPKLGWPTLKQPTFNWGATDKYTELENVRLEVNDIFKSYNENDTENINYQKLATQTRYAIHRHFTKAEQETCNTVKHFKQQIPPATQWDHQIPSILQIKQTKWGKCKGMDGKAQKSSGRMQL